MKKIVVAEDEPNMLNSIALLLKREGFEVIKAGNGAEALAYISDTSGHDVALLITDVNMPYFSGIEVITTLRKAGIKIPVIVISGFLDRELKDQLETMGVTAVIDKPFEAETLINEVRRALE